MLPTSRPAAGMAARQDAASRLRALARTVARAWRAAARAAAASVQGAEDAAHHAKERAEAVAETASRAAVAPKEVAHEVRKEIEAWSGGVARVTAMGAVVGVLALFALVILSVGAIVLLNEVVGDPYGTLLVGALYVVAAIGALAWMLGARREMQAELHRHAEHARQDVAHVTQPLKAERADVQPPRRSSTAGATRGR